MNPHTEYQDQEVSLNSAYNPFPEPQTIPSGWDLSELIAVPQVEVDASTIDASQVEFD